MKRAIPVFVVLVAALSVLLYLRLRKQRLEAERPSGGSATVEGTEVDVVARLPSRILSIKVEAGDRVSQGQVLVELDCENEHALLAQADAALGGAKIALSAAKTQQGLSKQGVRSARSQVWMAYAVARAAKAQKLAVKVQRGVAYRTQKRFKKIHQAGALSDQQLDRTQSAVAGLDQQLRALQENINAANARALAATSGKRAAHIREQLTLITIQGALQKIKAAEAARRRASIAVRECTLRAPRAGYVLSRSFEPGEVVLPGSRVLTLVDIREVRATFYLPNAELAAARPGRAVKVKADAYKDQTFDGRIRRVGVEAEFTPRNVQTRQDRDRLVYAVEVVIPNPKGLLRPGMPVEITIPGTGKGSR
jgi:HlyD family secretion protein